MTLDSLDISLSVEVGELPSFLSAIDRHVDVQHLVVRDAVDCAAIDKICSLTTLTYLSLTHCECEDLPVKFADLQALEKLHLVLGPMQTELPEPLTKLLHLKNLHIEGNGLLAVPRNLAELKEIEELNFGESPIQELPDFLGSLPRLKRIILSHTAGIIATVDRFCQKYPQIEVILP